MVRTGPDLGPVPPPLARQRVRIELPCGSCVHHGVCTIEEQVEQDVTLNIIGVAVPIRLYLGCSVYSKRRGPRPAEHVERARIASVAAKTQRTVDPRARGKRHAFPSHRFRQQPLDRSTSGG